MRRLGAAGMLAAAGLAASAVPVYAHGLGQRYDLPIPLSYFLVGAAAAVALSFVVIGLFVRHEGGTFRYPRLDLLRVQGLGTVLKSGITLTCARFASVFLFLLVLATALFGTDNPLENLAPTFVWIIWWVGIGYVSALFGNVWALMNPWKILYEWVERLAGGRDSGTRGSDAMFVYPAGLDVWPAFALLLVFAWLENVYSEAAVPERLGMLVVAYSVFTWAGMAVFGKHTWLRYCEVFSVLLAILARFSPTEVRVVDERVCRACTGGCGAQGKGCVDCYDCFERAGARGRELNLRPHAVGLILHGRASTGTAAFVVLALATVTFDGLAATPFWLDYQNFTYPFGRLFGAYAIDAVDSLGLVLLPAVFMTVYLGFAWGVKAMSGDSRPAVDVAQAFVFTLVPIALAYNMAHFVSVLAIQGQFIIPLASDPFGWRWDLFGTYDYVVNVNAISAKAVWFISVAAIVIGHIVSVYAAHVTALGRTPDQGAALRGQYPMLALMVGYTATSLWIVAQPIVNQ